MKREKPLFTADESMRLYKVLAEHYRPTKNLDPEGKPYWAWDNGWNWRSALEAADIEPDPHFKSRVDHARLEHFGKTEEKRLPRPIETVVTERMASARIRTAENDMVTLRDKVAKLTSFAHGELQRFHNLHNDLVAKHNQIVHRVRALESRPALIEPERERDPREHLEQIANGAEADHGGVA